MTLRTLTLASLLVGTPAIPAQGQPAAGAPRWPVVRLVDTVLAVGAPHGRVLLRVPLPDRAGRVRYTLACRGGSAPAVSDDGPPDSLWVAGALVCRLHSGRGDGASTLLRSDEAPIWYTGGFVRYTALADPAQRMRTFRLRGLALALRFERVAFDGATLRSFDLHVTARPDARATSAYVATMAPRMCRDWTDSRRLGSWAECPAR